jgi:hypothetical protein
MSSTFVLLEARAMEWSLWLGDDMLQRFQTTGIGNKAQCAFIVLHAQVK